MPETGGVGYQCCSCCAWASSPTRQGCPWGSAHSIPAAPKQCWSNSRADPRGECDGDGCAQCPGDCACRPRRLFKEHREIIALQCSPGAGRETSLVPQTGSSHLQSALKQVPVSSMAGKINWTHLSPSQLIMRLTVGISLSRALFLRQLVWASPSSFFAAVEKRRALFSHTRCRRWQMDRVQGKQSRCI